MTNRSSVLCFFGLGLAASQAACGADSTPPSGGSTAVDDAQVEGAEGRDGVPRDVSDEDDDTIVTDDDTTTTPEPVPAIDATATFEVVTTFDLPVSALLPEPASQAVGTLSDFRDDPSATLFTILDEAGVPGASELRDAMPGPLEDELDDLINESLESAQVDGTPATDHLDFVLDQTELVLGQFDLVTALTLAHDGAAPDLAATHRVRALRIPAGSATEIEIPEDQAVDAVLTLEASPTAQVVEGTELVVGDHAFGLPYGEHAWMALDLAMHEAYGTDLRGALGEIVDCAGLAASVADECVFGVCVGHEEELADLCEQGLDLLVGKLHDEFAALRFDAVRLQSGQATLVDAPAADGRADALADGEWQASLDLGQGPREVPASFTGTRMQ